MLEVRTMVFEQRLEHWCQELQSMGIDVRLADNTRAEAKVGGFTGVLVGALFSVGLVDVAKGPIRWIRLMEYQHDSVSPPTYTLVFGVPDAGITEGMKHLKIRTIRSKSVPLIGRVKDLHWRGVEARHWRGDLGLGLISKLEANQELRRQLMPFGDLVIETDFKMQCWMMVSLLRRTMWLSHLDQWIGLQRLAQELLDIHTSASGERC